MILASRQRKPPGCERAGRVELLFDQKPLEPRRLLSIDGMPGHAHTPCK